MWQSFTIKELRVQLSKEKSKNAILTKKVRDFESQLEKLESETARSFQESPNSESTESSPSGRELSSAEVIKAFGFIKDVYEEAGKTYLVIDYAEMLTGEEARRAREEDGAPPDPEDFYIRNRNPRLRTYEIASDVIITMITWELSERGVVEDTQITLSEFKNIFSSSDADLTRLAEVPYWIELKEDKVITIKEQYIP